MRPLSSTNNDEDDDLADEGSSDDDDDNKISSSGKLGRRLLQISHLFKMVLQISLKHNG